MTRVLDQRATPCGLGVHLRDQPHFQRSVSSGLGVEHLQFTLKLLTHKGAGDGGWEQEVLTSGENEQSPALSSIYSLH